MNKNLILAVVAVVCLAAGYGVGVMSPANGGGNAIGINKAETKAKNFVNEYLVSQGQNATISNVSEEKGLYAMSLEVGGQSVDSYMTKDGKLFFPQGIDTENPPQQQQSGQQQNAQQQMSPSQQAEAMVSQGNSLLEQFGDSMSTEEQQTLETKINELEELNNAEDTGDQELQQKMQEVQEATRPIMEQIQQQQGTSTQQTPQQ